MKHTIYYYPSLGNDTYIKEFEENPLAIQEVGFEPKQLLKWRNEEQTFTKCPAYLEWAKKTWVVEFPTDLEIRVDLTNKNIGLSNNNWEPCIGLQGEELWEKTMKPCFQLTTGFLFWTESKNIWLQVTGPQESVWRNNFRTIEGQYPISVWTRSTNLAFQMEEHQRPILLKRGDPIMYVSFFSGAVKDSFYLEKRLPDEKIIRRKNRTEYLKHLIPDFSWKIIAKRNQEELRESKCPFAKAKSFFSRKPIDS